MEDEDTAEEALRAYQLKILSQDELIR
jgi:hypothetical protein